MIKRTNFKGTWGLKGPVTALAVYSCVLFPALHIIFPQAQQWAPFIYPAYFGVTILVLMLTRHATGTQLGFQIEHWQQSMILGSLAGVLVIAMVPLLELLINFSGLGRTELFAGADQRLFQDLPQSSSFITFVLPMMLTVVAEQGFLTGYVLQSLLRRCKPVLAIYLGGLLFTLVHFDLQLGWFLLGLLASSLYWLTGSLVAPLIFQAACHTGGWLLTHHYPKVYTLVGFLF